MVTIATLQKKQYIEETNDIYNVDKSKSYNIKHNRYTDEHCYIKAQFITNNLTNYITKINNTTNTENVFKISNNTFLRSIILQMCLGVITVILKIMYIRNVII